MTEPKLCPKCGATQTSGPKHYAIEWACMSQREPLGDFHQSDRCRIREQENERDRLRMALDKLVKASDPYTPFAGNLLATARAEAVKLLGDDHA